MKNYSVLIIDDHPITSLAYKSACDIISSEDENCQFEVDFVIDCDSAIKKIENAVKLKNIIDIIFLDIRLPSSSDGKFLTGEDIGIWVFYPNSNIFSR